MTGCVFDRSGNLFASDLGTAQGQFPSPDDGRLIEWFAPAYSTYCIVAGPTSGGVGPHHVDGTGGLSQPGDLALAPNGDIMLPEATGIAGKVLRLDGDSLPHSAADCGPDGLYPPGQLRSKVFVQGSLSMLPFPQSIARDPRCNCWAVATVIGNPAIAFFDDYGNRLTGIGVVPGESIVQVGTDPNGYNPFGIAFGPDGTGYFVDIHIQCSAPLTNCGPEDNAGRVMKIPFVHGHPTTPVVVTGGLNFPTSVTVCVLAAGKVCPAPGVPGAASASRDRQPAIPPA
jgi:hypothetical protein